MKKEWMLEQLEPDCTMVYINYNTGSKLTFDLDKITRQEIRSSLNDNWEIYSYRGFRIYVDEN